MDLTLLEKFVVGNSVVVADSSSASILEGLRTYGLAGCVQKIDYKAGVCVQLFISRIFQPCFWYQPSCLATQTEMIAFMPLDWKSIEARIGNDPAGVKPKNSVILGCMRSWLISKAGAKPGQSLYVFISKMTYSECLTVYQGLGNSFELWLKANDTRVRRPQMLGETDSNTIDITSNSKFRGPLSAKRPKIGG